LSRELNNFLVFNNPYARFYQVINVIAAYYFLLTHCKRNFFRQLYVVIEIILLVGFSYHRNTRSYFIFEQSWQIVIRLSFCQIHPQVLLTQFNPIFLSQSLIFRVLIEEISCFWDSLLNYYLTIKFRYPPYFFAIKVINPSYFSRFPIRDDFSELLLSVSSQLLTNSSNDFYFFFLKGDVTSFFQIFLQSYYLYRLLFDAILKHDYFINYFALDLLK